MTMNIGAVRVDHPLISDPKHPEANFYDGADPELLVDILPQPYRMIDKVLWEIVDTVTEECIIREEKNILSIASKQEAAFCAPAFRARSETLGSLASVWAVGGNTGHVALVKDDICVIYNPRTDDIVATVDSCGGGIVDLCVTEASETIVSVAVLSKKGVKVWLLELPTGTPAKKAHAELMFDCYRSSSLPTVVHVSPGCRFLTLSSPNGYVSFYALPPIPATVIDRRKEETVKPSVSADASSDSIPQGVGKSGKVSSSRGAPAAAVAASGSADDDETEVEHGAPLSTPLQEIAPDSWLVDGEEPPSPEVTPESTLESHEDPSRSTVVGVNPSASAVDPAAELAKELHRALTKQGTPRVLFLLAPSPHGVDEYVKMEVQSAIVWRRMSTKVFRFGMSVPRAAPPAPWADLVPAREETRVEKGKKGKDKDKDKENKDAKKDAGDAVDSTFGGLRVDNPKTHVFSAGVTCVALDFATIMLAIGMHDGNCFVWDNILDIEKLVLNKHVEAVTSVGFYRHDLVVSSGAEGAIHAHELPGGGLLYVEKKEMLHKAFVFKDAPAICALQTLPPELPKPAAAGGGPRGNALRSLSITASALSLTGRSTLSTADDSLQRRTVRILDAFTGKDAGGLDLLMAPEDRQAVFGGYTGLGQTGRSHTPVVPSGPVDISYDGVAMDRRCEMLILPLRFDQHAACFDPVRASPSRISQVGSQANAAEATPVQRSRAPSRVSRPTSPNAGKKQPRSRSDTPDQTDSVTMLPPTEQRWFVGYSGGDVFRTLFETKENRYSMHAGARMSPYSPLLQMPPPDATFIGSVNAHTGCGSPALLPPPSSHSQVMPQPSGGSMSMGGSGGGNASLGGRSGAGARVQHGMTGQSAFDQSQQTVSPVKPKGAKPVQGGIGMRRRSVSKKDPSGTDATKQASLRSILDSSADAAGAIAAGRAGMPPGAQFFNDPSSQIKQQLKMRTLYRQARDLRIKQRKTELIAEVQNRCHA